MTGRAVIGKIRDMIGSRVYKKLSVLALLLGAICAVLFNACSDRNEGKVIVIEKTKTYHRAECPKVNMAKTQFMTIAEAESAHCAPCRQCMPHEQ